MKTIKLRDVDGPRIEELAESGELVGITSNRVLVGVLCPISRSWLEHVVEMNFSRLNQNIAAGEDDLAAGTGERPTLAKLLAGAASAGAQEDASEEPHASFPVPGVDKLIATMSNVRDALLSPDAAGAENRGNQAITSQTVRLGDLSHSVIEQAGKAGQMLAITNNHVIVGIIAPVTEALVAHLVEERMTAVLYNIDRGERDVAQGRTQALNDVLAETDSKTVANATATSHRD